MTAPIEPDEPGASNGDSLIAQHLKLFEASSAPARDTAVPEAPSRPVTTLSPKRSSVHEDKTLIRKDKGWWIAGLVGACLILVTTRALSSHPETKTTAEPSPVASGRTDALGSDTSRLLAQLVAASSSATASNGLEALTAGTMSIDAFKSAMDRFKGISTGRFDPFRVIHLVHDEPKRVTLPPPPKARPTPFQITLTPVTPPPPTLRPTMPPTPPPPPVSARLLGVVEGEEAVALVEVLRGGVAEKHRFKQREVVSEGYRVAEIAHKVVILHTVASTVVGLPIGKLVELPYLMASPSANPKWPETAASR